MEKIVAFSLIFVIVLGLAACSSTEKTESVAKDAATEETSVKFYVFTALICYSLAFVFAVLLTKSPRLKECSIYRTQFFLPSTIPGKVIALI